MTARIRGVKVFGFRSFSWCARSNRNERWSSLSTRAWEVHLSCTSSWALLNLRWSASCRTVASTPS